MLSIDVPKRVGDTGGTPANVLLVDDNPVNLQVLLGSLDGRGYRLLVARDGRAALDIAGRVHPDIVLLDVLMPGLGGFDVCRELKANPATAGAPVIFLSALGDVSDKVAGLSLGAVDYITKPIQPEEVVARVDVHLTRHLLERELQRSHDRLNRELARAADMQRLILPPSLPPAGPLQFAAHYQTSRYAGGDYYDVVPFADKRVGIFVLDVSGHGAPAAIVMAMMRTVVHMLPGLPDEPGSMLRAVHRHFDFLRNTAVYATAVCALVDWARGTMSVACAGHPPPLRYRPGHEVLPIPCEATTPLLLTDLDEVPSTTHDLRPGDRLLFYTDGVTDREAPSGIEYNAERLARSLSRSGDQPVERAVASIVDDVETFAGGREPQDDSTLLLMSMQ